MALTLEEAKVGYADKVEQNVIDEFRRSSILLDKLTFDDTISPTGGSNLVYGYQRLETPSTASVRQINAEYSYFPLDILQFQVKQPLLATNTAENYDITINLDGGGIKGQAEAARLGIARALCEIDAEFRPVLKKNGFLTRDPREVERKKPGQPGARRKFQFSKR